MPNIFVVAGHGGRDPGAVGNGYREADLTRQLAARLSSIGGTSVMVGDMSIDWYANNAFSYADIPSGYEVVELHLDSASSSSARGGHVIIKNGFSPDTWDSNLASMCKNMFPGRSNLISYRDDLQNVNVAAQRGISYRLLEVCMISNYDDVSAFVYGVDTVARNILSAFDISVEPVVPEHWTGPGVEYNGATRYDTIKLIAEAAHPNAEHVVSVKGSSFSDCASIMWLAGALNAKIIYDEDAPEINGWEISGPDRFATNLAVKKLGELFGVYPSYEHCFVVGQDAYADAVTCAGWSYSHQVPILLYHSSDDNFWKQIGLYRKVTVIGGGIPTLEFETERIAGSDRGETCAMFQEIYYQNWSLVNVVSSSGFADGMAMGQRAGDSPILLAGWQASYTAVAKHKNTLVDPYFTWCGGKNSIDFDTRTAFCKHAGLM